MRTNYLSEVRYSPLSHQPFWKLTSYLERTLRSCLMYSSHSPYLYSIEWLVKKKTKLCQETACKKDTWWKSPDASWIWILLSLDSYPSHGVDSAPASLMGVSSETMSLKSGVWQGENKKTNIINSVKGYPQGSRGIRSVLPPQVAPHPSPWPSGFSTIFASLA